MTSFRSRRRLGSALSNKGSPAGSRSYPRAGQRFAFVGSQYPFNVGGQDFYLDLPFYHLRIRCFVVFELKVEGFKPEFAGKMNFYFRRSTTCFAIPSTAPRSGSSSATGVTR